MSIAAPCIAEAALSQQAGLTAPISKRPPKKRQKSAYSDRQLRPEAR
ncbi:hypothetical protein [Sphingomicrobium aestuariivivum]|nr:hypothetical protein [Sphingomicrobium aestuariivivum]MCJ8191771.1 hypothetical protein [Sphingomicrobium aestuariivivum]